MCGGRPGGDWPSRRSRPDLTPKPVVAAVLPMAWFNDAVSAMSEVRVGPDLVCGPAPRSVRQVEMRPVIVVDTT